MNLYEQCQAIFDTHPLAVAPGPHADSMVLAAPGFRFFTLLRYADGGFALHSWQSGGTITDRETAAILAAALPLPRDGALFGWAPGGTVTALITFCTRDPQPSWSTMPLAGSPERDWPPFTGEHLLGPWFWEHLAASTIVDIGSCLAGSLGTIWWVDAGLGTGEGVIAVSRDLRLCDVTVPRGVYAYTRGASASLDKALASGGKTDLGPRFTEAA